MSLPHWMCSGCGLFVVGTVGKCNGQCQDPTGTSCDATPCPSCARIHYWTGSVEPRRALTQAGWSKVSPLSDQWEHPEHGGPLVTHDAFALLVEIARRRPMPRPRTPTVKIPLVTCTPPAAFVPIDDQTREALAYLYGKAIGGDPNGAVSVDALELGILCEAVAEWAGIPLGDLR